MNASKCPNCGKTFSAVRCPKCSYVGQPGEFAKGCPNCGYSEAAPQVPENTSRRSPARRSPSRGLSPVLYGIIGFILIAAVGVLIILYSRIL